MKKLVFATATLLLSLATALAQEPAAPPQPPPQQQGGGWAGMPAPVTGVIQSIKDNTMVVTQKDGKPITVTITTQTHFRKAGQPAKLTDFKVGDKVMIPGKAAEDGSWTARAIVPEGEFGNHGGGQNGQGRGGSQGGQRGEGQRGPLGGMMQGELGKDYVMGRVISVDVDKLTITIERRDGVKQTLVVDEQTSFRSPEGSITLADIKSGDRVMGHGALNKAGVFVPKNLMVMGAGEMHHQPGEPNKNDESPAAPPAI